MRAPRARWWCPAPTRSRTGISWPCSTRPNRRARRRSPWSGGEMIRRRQPWAEMITKPNMTPLIDVALVLVIILLVTAPMLSVADLPVQLPQAVTREAEDERNVSITLGARSEEHTSELQSLRHL